MAVIAQSSNPFSELSLPLGEYGWLYYAVCAILFTLAGLICGYFIWRKGNMQTVDAEMEIQLNESELKNSTSDFENESEMLAPDQEEDRVGDLLSNFGEESKENSPAAPTQQG